MARTDPQVNLRMPAELKDRLDEAAESNKRSLTAEIVARLEASFDALPKELFSQLESLVLAERERAAALQDSTDALRRDASGMAFLLSEIAPAVPLDHEKRPYADIHTWFTNWLNKKTIAEADKRLLEKKAQAGDTAPPNPLERVAAVTRLIEERRREPFDKAQKRYDDMRDAMAAAADINIKR